MPNKQEALQEIITIARNNQLTAEEVMAALKYTQAIPVQKSGGILSRIFTYIGSILVFAGICIFIGMQWDQFTSGARITVTLGTGFAAFLLALVAMDHPKHYHSATPLLLMAAIFQPTGIFVMLNEYSLGTEPLYSVLFVSTVMLIEQGATFWQKKRTILAFTTIFFSCSFLITVMELLEVDRDFISLITGILLMWISWALSHSSHRAIAVFWYFIGSSALLIAAFDLLQGTLFEPLYFGIPALIIYISTAARSRTLLLIGTLSMLAYISHFTYEHFRNTLGWPLVLIICGIAFIAIGSIAIKINSRYMRETI